METKPETEKDLRLAALKRACLIQAERAWRYGSRADVLPAFIHGVESHLGFHAETEDQFVSLLVALGMPRPVEAETETNDDLPF